MLSRIVNARFAPTSSDVGLLLLRVGTGMILFLKHGHEKIGMIGHSHASFPDLIHIGSNASFAAAMVSDSICSLLIVIGLGTRWASLFTFGTLFVAWALKHHFAFFGTMRDMSTWTIDSVFGEIITQILVACLVLMVAGPGRFSIDSLLKKMSYKPSKH